MNTPWFLRSSRRCYDCCRRDALHAYQGVNRSQLSCIISNRSNETVEVCRRRRHMVDGSRWCAVDSVLCVTVPRRQHTHAEHCEEPPAIAQVIFIKIRWKSGIGSKNRGPNLNQNGETRANPLDSHPVSVTRPKIWSEADQTEEYPLHTNNRWCVGLRGLVVAATRNTPVIQLATVP